jgi:hypothetical protein
MRRAERGYPDAIGSAPALGQSRNSVHESIDEVSKIPLP